MTVTGDGHHTITHMPAFPSVEHMRARLRQCHQACRTFDDNLLLIKAECRYQEYVGRFSPAYLSGSPWYVGASLIESVRSRGLEAAAVAELARSTNDGVDNAALIGVVVNVIWESSSNHWAHAPDAPAHVNQDQNGDTPTPP